MISAKSDPDEAASKAIHSAADRREGIALSAVSWDPKRDLSAQEWMVSGHKLGKISRASQWWIGDWVRYGTQKWGEKYAAAARITGYDVASLRNMAWVAAQFDPSLRNDELTWSHHVLVASLERDEKEYWLNEAVRKRLSVADLRVALRSERSRNKTKLPLRDKLSKDAAAIVCPKCGHHINP